MSQLGSYCPLLTASSCGDSLDKSRPFLLEERERPTRQPGNLRNPYSEASNSKSKPDAAGRYQVGKEAVMLDLAFVALGFAVIGLMGFYAFALRQL